jgi:Prokaryotic E2 family E
MLPGQLLDEVEQLRADGYKVELVEAEGWANLSFLEYAIPCRYNKRESRLLVRAPLAYPNGKPDMFWTDPELTFADGRIPEGAGTIETALGQQWRRFSWHPQSWNPGVDDIRTYLEFVNNRLAKAQ